VQLHTSASECKSVGNITRSNYVKSLFSSSVAFLIVSDASQKRRPFNADFSRVNMWISQQEFGHKSMGDAPVLLHCYLLRKILDQNGLVCWSIVVKEKPTVGSPFSGRLLPTAFLRRQRMLAFFLQQEFL
jgi:hypothetical protein